MFTVELGGNTVHPRPVVIMAHHSIITVSFSMFARTIFYIGSCYQTVTTPNVKNRLGEQTEAT